MHRWCFVLYFKGVHAVSIRTHGTLFGFVATPTLLFTAGDDNADFRGQILDFKLFAFLFRKWQADGIAAHWISFLTILDWIEIEYIRYQALKRITQSVSDLSPLWCHATLPLSYKRRKWKIYFFGSHLRPNLKFENFTSSLGRLRQRNVLKRVQRVQRDYFSSFNQSYNWFVVLPLLLPSLFYKLSYN